MTNKEFIENKLDSIIQSMDTHFHLEKDDNLKHILNTHIADLIFLKELISLSDISEIDLDEFLDNIK